MPVSYTHLDVYKRQGEDMQRPERAEKLPADNAVELKDVRFASVSYTHLDVYKRQTSALRFSAFVSSLVCFFDAARRSLSPVLRSR